MFQQVHLHGDIMQEITCKKYGKENNIRPLKFKEVNANPKSMRSSHLQIQRRRDFNQTT